jgi:hypothetical protein
MDRYLGLHVHAESCDSSLQGASPLVRAAERSPSIWDGRAGRGAGRELPQGGPALQVKPVPGVRIPLDSPPTEAYTTNTVSFPPFRKIAEMGKPALPCAHGTVGSRLFLP